MPKKDSGSKRRKSKFGVADESSKLDSVSEHGDVFIPFDKSFGSTLHPGIRAMSVKEARDKAFDLFSEFVNYDDIGIVRQKDYVANRMRRWKREWSKRNK